MPTVRARIRPGETVRRHSNKYGPGITPRYLASGEVGDIEFDTSLFTESQAIEWLTSHDYSQYTLSAGEDDPQDENKHHRFLAIELAPSADIQEIDGGLLVPGVKLLAPGTWTDSTQKTPCRYTPEILERYHANWTDMSYWSRHSGGTPRDITDRIADIRNVRYQDGVIADLFFHGATTKSQDAISLLKAASAGKVPWPYSSVEMMTRDKWIVSEKLYEAQEVLFDGAAMVNQGACRVCRIRNNEWVQEDRPGRELGSVPDNPSGAKIGEDAESCKLTEESFGDMEFSEIRKRFAYDGNAKGEEKFTALKLPHHSVDGTVRPNCVRAALQAIGGARQGTPMDLGGKEAAVKAHLETHLNEINRKKEQEMTDNKELEAENTRLKKELEELKAKSPEPPKAEVPKELTELIATQDKTIKELSARLEKLEKAPADPKTSGAAISRELAAPEYYVPVDRKAGIVGD